MVGVEYADFDCSGSTCSYKFPTDYLGGSCASWFRNYRDSIRYHGMEIIPEFNTLSHAMETGFTNEYRRSDPPLDRGLMEFDSTMHFPIWCGDLHGPIWNGTPCHAPDAITDPYNDTTVIYRQLVRVDAASQAKIGSLFREYLRVIKANWGSPSPVNKKNYPNYIHIGHDELGWNRTLLVGGGKSGLSTPGEKFTAVKNEIEDRIRDVDAVFTNVPSSDTIKIILYGDSFLAGDYGAFFGAYDWHYPAGLFRTSTPFCGDSITGAGGILAAIKADFPNRIIVMPWMYEGITGAPAGELDGESNADRQLAISRQTWLGYLNTLGIPYILRGGEDQGPNLYTNDTSRVKEEIYQWHKAALLYPNQYLGFDNYMYDWEDTTKALCSWGPNGHCRFTQTLNGTTLSVGWSAALSAFLDRRPYLLSVPYDEAKTYFCLDFSKSQTRKVYYDKCNIGTNIASNVVLF
jgi:hypothetical protein